MSTVTVGVAITTGKQPERPQTADHSQDEVTCTARRRGHQQELAGGTLFLEGDVAMAENENQNAMAKARVVTRCSRWQARYGTGRLGRCPDRRGWPRRQNRSAPAARIPRGRSLGRRRLPGHSAGSAARGRFVRLLPGILAWNSLDEVDGALLPSTNMRPMYSPMMPSDSSWMPPRNSITDIREA